jgi:exo-beta-1,3-glucanase (GH17 family)
VKYLRAVSRHALLAITLYAAGGVNAAPVVCVRNPQAGAALSHLRNALRDDRFVTYEPTTLKVWNGVKSPADAPSIRADLRVLRDKFDALVTYDALHGAEQIAPIAAQLQFHALIIGVWNPADDAEVAAALAAARGYPQLVVGISLGNETIFAHRSDPATLVARIARIRAQAPAVALTTTEPFHIYYEPGSQALLQQLDFLLVNVHPIFQPWFRDAPDSNAAQFVVNVVSKLRPLACGPLLVKETGEPTAPAAAGYSPERQASFYRELRRVLTPTPAQAFAYFAAFDAPWRASDASPAPGAHPEEGHWGLYDSARRPKPAASELPALPAQH